jgi:hypothetical protein
MTMTATNNAMRDERGRFTLGNSGNPRGRSPRKVEQNYLDLAKHRCGKSEWQAIVEKAVDQAKGGDARARQWLSDYLIGKPVALSDSEKDVERATIAIQAHNSIIEAIKGRAK